MPETPVGWAFVAVSAALAVIAIVQRIALARVNQVNVNTDKSAVENERERAGIAQSTLLNEIAATALKTKEREGDAREALAELRGVSNVQAVRLDFLEKNNVRLEKSNERLETANRELTKANRRLEKRLDDRDEAHRLETVGTNAQITDLNAEITRLKTLVDGLPMLTDALREEIRVNKDASATPEQVSAAERASADATAATLTPAPAPLPLAGAEPTRIEGLVVLTPTTPAPVPKEAAPDENDNSEAAKESA